MSREHAPSRLGVFLLLLWLVISMAWWAMAFAPVGSGTPDWLVRTQAVCFGRLENGLPDTYGWVLLVAAPLSMLTGLLAIWQNELWPGLIACFTHFTAKVLGGILAVVVLAEAGWVGVRIHRALQLDAGPLFTIAGSMPKNYPRGTEAAPDFSLTDQDGRSLRLSAYRGRTVLLTFAFGHCQTLCPAVVHSALNAVQQLSGRIPPAEAPALLIVTLDPWRDTPGALAGVARQWELPGFAHFLSGDADSVHGVLERYNVPWSRDEKTGDIGHPPLLYIIDPDGRLAYTLNNSSTSWIRQALIRILQPSRSLTGLH